MIEKVKSKLYILSSNNILLVISIVIIIFIIAFSLFNRGNVRNRFIKYLNKMDYYSSDGGYLYCKNIGGSSLDEFYDGVTYSNDSTYELNCFDIDSVLFKKNKRKYSGGINTLLNESYSFKDKKVTYNYRLEETDEATFIFSGEYYFASGKYNFTCEREYAYQYDVNDDDSVICSRIEYEVDEFYREAIDAVDNYSLLKRMIK